ALGAAIQHRHAFTLYAETRARLRTFWHLQMVLAIRRRDIQFRPKRCLRDRDRHRAIEVIAFALEELVLRDAQHDVEIARPAALMSRIAASAIAQRCAVLDPGRYLHLEFRILRDAPSPFALLAQIGHHLPRTSAVATRARHSEEALLEADLSASLA